MLNIFIANIKQLVKMFQAKKFLENMHQEQENTETIEKIVEIFLVAMIV